jgi:hypothetical protein
MFPASSKIWLINVFLAALVVFVGFMSYDIWTKKDEAIPEIQAVKSSGTPSPVKGIAARAMPPESTYGIVAEKNLFFSNRAESLPKELKPDAPKISEKMIYLYGVVILGDKKQALISNPESGKSAAGKGGKDKWVKVGDAIGNFSVAEIGKEKIVLTEGGNRHEILLYDSKKPARQIVAQKPAAPTVVATGSTAPAAAAKISGAGSPTATPAPAPAPTPAPPVAAGKSEPAGEYKIVNTPFGPVKRRIK